MHLQSLSIINYKNIRQTEIEFSPKINCFIGSNGSGKTNILDTIYYLSYCKSHNNNIDNQNITHNEDFFVIQGHFLFNGIEEDIYCGLKRKQRKNFKRNKKEYDRLSEHIGVLPLVLISPDDNKLITEGSDERRRFIDSIISQHDKEYLYTLIRYNNALSQRNSLVKNHNTDNSLFEIWEEQLSELGSFIYQKRIEFIEQFTPIFESFYQFLSRNNESISLRYISHLQDGESLQTQLSKSRERDSILGYTTKGIHKDELEMLLDNYPIKREGSQGQNKTYLIALKFAQFDFLKRLSKVTPILLLDDIFDKLDANRVKQIIQLVSEDNFGQIFITDTNREHLDDILKHIQQDARIFTVENGEILK